MDEHETAPPVAAESLGTNVWQDAAGRPHRDDGPAVVYADGSSEWYRHGALHRDDGPALCRRHLTAWFHNGLLHRVDGPAEESLGVERFWLFGVQLSAEEFAAFSALEPAASAVALRLFADHAAADGPVVDILAAATAAVANA